MLPLTVLLFVIYLSFVAANNNQPQPSFYTNNPDIYELTPSTFNQIIHDTNYTTIVKFYAPWCGYCKQLHQPFTKLGSIASNLPIQVAAVNCDLPANKQLCSAQQVSSYPTLKVFRPPKFTHGKPFTRQKHAVEDYGGERSTKAMFEFVLGRVKNYIRGLNSIDKMNTWIKAQTGKSKVVLVSEKTRSAGLIKGIAIDFLDVAEFGMLSWKKSMELPLPIGDVTIESVPSLISYNEEHGYSLYEGDLKNKKEIETWLSQLGKPLEGELSDKYALLQAIKSGKSPKKSKSKTKAKSKSKLNTKQKAKTNSPARDEL